MARERIRVPEGHERRVVLDQGRRFRRSRPGWPTADPRPPRRDRFRWLRGQSLQPQEPSDSLLQLGPAGCQRPNQVDSPRQDILHDPACSYLRTAYLATDSRIVFLTGHRIGLQMEHRPEQVEVLGLTGQRRQVPFPGGSTIVDQ